MGMQYTPTVGSCLATSCAAYSLLPGRKGLSRGLLAVLCLGYAKNCGERAMDWTDEVRLWRAAHRTNPGSSHTVLSPLLAFAREDRVDTEVGEVHLILARWLIGDAAGAVKAAENALERMDERTAAVRRGDTMLWIGSPSKSEQH